MESKEKADDTKEVTKDEVLQSNSDEDDGPPPGFESLPLNSLTYKNNKPKKENEEDEEDDDDDDDDGPPPGFQSISLKNENEKEKIESFVEEDDDDDGPPPGFHSVHVIKQDDDVSMSNSHSVPVIEPERGDGLNPNFHFEVGKVGDGSELGFQSIPVIGKEKGLQSVSIKESELGLQSISVKGEEKTGDGSELGLQSVPNKEEVKEGDESEIGSQSVPMIEDEKRKNVCGTGFQSISQKVGEEEKDAAADDDDDGDDDEGPPPGWGSFPQPRQTIESPTPPHQTVSSGTATEPAHVKEQKKVGDGFEVGSQSVPMQEDEKERGGSELESQSFPVKAENKGSSSVKEKENNNDDGSNNNDEGPPPGWGSFPHPRQPKESPGPPHQLLFAVSSGIATEPHVKEEEKVGDEFEVGSQSVPMQEDERERNGSELESQSVPVKAEEKGSSPVKEEERIDNDDDEGPPPGWGSFSQPRQPIESPAPPHQLPSAVSSAPESAHVKEEEEVGNRLKFGSDPMIEEKEEGDGSEIESQSCPFKAEEKGSSPIKEEDDDDEGPPPGWDSFHPPSTPSEAPSPPHLLPPTLAPTHQRPSATSSGKAQMICGSCRTLLSYSKGARFVQCSCCQTVNLVLEEHQVGQVRCRGCSVLLMYPYGAPSVQCSSCLFVTKIGVQNKRPPLSLQQSQPQVSANSLSEAVN